MGMIILEAEKGSSMWEKEVRRIGQGRHEKYVRIPFTKGNWHMEEENVRLRKKPQVEGIFIPFSIGLLTRLLS